MVSLIGSYNNLPLSQLIRAGTGEPISHLAICFDQRLIFHSHFLGAHPLWRATFEKENTIHTEYLIPNLFLEEEEKIYQECIKFDGTPYDYPALVYMILAGGINLLMDKPLPTHNPWNEKKMSLCTEVATCLSPVLKYSIDLSASTPWEVIQETKRILNG